MGNNRRGRSRGPTFFYLILMIAVALAIGYAGAEYLIYPYLSGESFFSKDPADSTESLENSTSTGIIVDQQEIQDVGMSSAESGTSPSLSIFSLQFGSFSTKEAAVTRQAELSGRSIPTYLITSDNTYKVLGMAYLDKEQARAHAAAWKAQDLDVFVSQQTIRIDNEARKTRVESLLRTYQEAKNLETAVDKELLNKVQEAIIIVLDELT